MRLSKSLERHYERASLFYSLVHCVVGREERHIFRKICGWGSRGLFHELYHLSSSKNHFVTNLLVWIGSSCMFSLGSVVLFQIGKEQTLRLSFPFLRVIFLSWAKRFEDFEPYPLKSTFSLVWRI